MILLDRRFGGEIGGEIYEAFAQGYDDTIDFSLNADWRMDDTQIEWVEVDLDGAKVTIGMKKARSSAE